MSEGKSGRAWEEHLRACGQCNYDKDCFECEVGAPDGRPGAHSCNCKHGPGKGYLLAEAWQGERLLERVTRAESVEVLDRLFDGNQRRWTDEHSAAGIARHAELTSARCADPGQ